jgi:hypothetical protein
MAHTSARRRLLAPALLAVALGGCGGSSSSSSPPASPSSASTPAAETPNGVAKPGATFAVGQPALVDFIPPSQLTKTPVTRLRITVRSIEKGTLADFKDVQLDAQQRAGSPVYVKVDITNAGSKPAQSDTVTADLQGIDNTGNTEQSLTIIGDFQRCNDSSSQAPIGPGKSLSTCLIYLVPGGIDKVAYTGTEAYISSPVIWR